MNAMIKTAIIAVTLMSSSFVGASTLDIEITGIKKPGTLALIIYDDPAGFESKSRKDGDPLSQQGIVKTIKEEVQTGVFKQTLELSDGVYALKFYIDSNYNDELDVNLLGIPKEQYGFSNVKGRFGPPNFKKAAFELNGNKLLRMKLNSLFRYSK